MFAMLHTVVQNWKCDIEKKKRKEKSVYEIFLTWLLKLLQFSFIMDSFYNTYL